MRRSRPWICDGALQAIPPGTRSRQDGGYEDGGAQSWQQAPDLRRLML
jgi:hypothetical protein